MTAVHLLPFKILPDREVNWKDSSIGTCFIGNPSNAREPSGVHLNLQGPKMDGGVKTRSVTLFWCKGKPCTCKAMHMQECACHVRGCQTPTQRVEKCQVLMSLWVCSRRQVLAAVHEPGVSDPTQLNREDPTSQALQLPRDS